MEQSIMRMLSRLGFYSGTFIFISGCAWVHQTAHLQLDPKIAPSNIGKDIFLTVKVVDKRPSSTIGHRGLDSKNARISTEQDVTRLFRQKILEGLTHKGFQVTSYAGRPAPLLTVEIRQIEYTTDMDFWKGTVQAKAALRAICSKNGVTFDRTYLSEQKKTAVEAPRAETNERLINNAISEVVQRLFEDDQLVRFLAY